MVCIHCGAETHVINSRLQKRSNQVWRRRRCLACGAVFTTEETPAYSVAWLVRGQTGSLQPFVRDKLFLSLHKACQHRKTALEDAGGLTDTVLSRLEPQNGVLERDHLVQTVLVALNRFDKAAATAYQAFHK